MRIIGYIGLICVVVDVYAAALTSFTFDGAIGSEATFDAHTVVENIMVLSISRGSGIAGTSGAGTFNSRGWTGDAIRDADDYLTLTIGVDAGFQYTLTSFSFDERRSGTGPHAWSLYSSSDSFSTELGSGSTSNTLTDQVVTLGDIFTDRTTATEFRLYGIMSESGSGTWRVDNVELFGSITPVPEPKAWAALIGTGLFGWVLYRRRFV